MRELDVFEHGKEFEISTSSFSAEDGQQAERSFLGVSLGLETKFVCSSCNSGWMSDLETQAKPILSRLMNDERTVLSPADQSIIATWFTKTMLIVQYALPSQLTDEMSVMRKELLSRHEPLLGSRLWIGRYGGDGRGPVVVHQHGIKFQSADDHEKDFKLFNAVFAFGPLIFVFYGRFDLEDLHMTASSSDKLRLIWPATSDVGWPPFETIQTEVELEEFSRLTPDGHAPMINPRRLAEQNSAS